MVPELVEVGLVLRAKEKFAKSLKPLYGSRILIHHEHTCEQTSRTPRSRFCFGVASAITISSFGSPLLGMATRRKRLGQTPSPRQRDGIFYQPQPAASRANGPRHLLPGILRRHSFRHRPILPHDLQ